MSKSYNAEKDEDRTQGYRLWHRHELPNDAYVMDMDQIEYKFADREIVPLKAIELSRVDTGVNVTDKYLANVLERFSDTDAQARAIRKFAKLMEIDAVLVLFAQDLSKFWLYNISTKVGWYKFNEERYKKWLRDFRE